MTLRRPAGGREAVADPPAHRLGFGRRAERRAGAVAAASRIWVEGRHDAELLELVWGDELRDGGIVVEPLHGIDGLVDAVRGVRPVAGRRLGVLVDHLVPGSKEQRIAAAVDRPDVLVTGIRSSTCGPASARGARHRRLAGRAIGTPWKEGVCRALGTDLDGVLAPLRNRVRSYADLRPELVGAVERLIDFVM